jgi:hypothetical protein
VGRACGSTAPANMFNPDMMKMAMEQMNRMTPEQACT